MPSTSKTVEQKMADYKKLMNRKMEAVSQVTDILSSFYEDDQAAILETVVKFFDLEIGDC